MKAIAFSFLFFVLASPLLPDEPQNTTSLKIDESYQKLWQSKAIRPAPPASDEEFLRRVYLDLTGRIPTFQQAKQYLGSEDPNRRRKLIGDLLNSTEHAQYFARIWTLIFLGQKKDRFVDPPKFQAWLQDQFQQNTGWDQMTRSLITAEGKLNENPELNWYAKQKLDASNLADNTSRIFLGIQLGCARCHNHPHDDWKLEDFYGMAAFYSGLERERLTSSERIQFRQLKEERTEMKQQLKEIKNSGADRASNYRKEMKQKVEQDREMFKSLLGISQTRSLTIITEIKGEKKVYPAKFLLTPETAHVSGNQREALAGWITSEENPFFAKAYVNRIWGLLMGRGFVEPVDDLGSSNTPSNPELLEFLANDFKSHKYDIKHLLSAILNSNTYQLSSLSKKDNAAEYCENAKVKMLTADQLFNSMVIATSAEKAYQQSEDFQEKRDAVHRYYVFLFDNDESKSNEDIFSGTIPQALFLMNGKMSNEIVRRAFKMNFTDDGAEPVKRVQTIFLSILSRKPTPSELEGVRTYVRTNENQTDAYEDLVWALFNSNEFLFNH